MIVHMSKAVPSGEWGQTTNRNRTYWNNWGGHYTKKQGNTDKPLGGGGGGAGKLI